MEHFTTPPAPPTPPEKPVGCGLCNDQGPLVLRAKCHLTAPLAVERNGDELIIRCYVPECNREVARFKIDVPMTAEQIRIQEESRNGEFYRHVGYQSIYPANAARADAKAKGGGA